MQQPPTALIFCSASLENSLALTISGCLGSSPLPSTLKMPCAPTRGAKPQHTPEALAGSLEWRGRDATPAAQKAQGWIVAGRGPAQLGLTPRGTSAGISNSLRLL